SAIDEIKRLYGWMATHDPGTTDWEGIGTGGSMFEGGFTSAAHGWATGVLPALTNDLLGVTPTGPGFATWSVSPHPGTVAWARGQLPTPHGPLDVNWTAGSGRTTFTLIVTAPAGTSGTVSVPTGGKQVRVLLDQCPTTDAHGSNGYVSLAVGSGRHVITVTTAG
ncbi:MAG TPA: alpha-L-rhamnosidase C-terminal domain-containing protein, partial [Pseudonocardiaceae bacterium]